MYYIYDYEEYYIAKTDNYYWAKKIADKHEGFVMEYCPFDGERLLYDSEWDYYTPSFFN